MVISRGQVDNDEERVVARLRPHAGEAVPPHGSRANADLSRHADVLCDRVCQRLITGNRRVFALAVFLGSVAGERSGLVEHSWVVNDWS